MPDTTTETGILPSIENMAAGLVTAAVTKSGTGEKAIAAVEHGAETFEQHNPDLKPILDGATDTVSALAEKHGASVVWSFLEDLFPFLEKLGHHDVTVPTVSAAAQPTT